MLKPRPKNRKPGKTIPVTRPPPIPAGRRWLFRLFALVVIPLVLLGGLEAALRLSGYGHSFHVFKRTSIDGREFLINDDLFGLKFFPPEMTRSPSAFRMEAKKPTGVFRIFILGESAAMGDPEPAYGASRYLEVMLRERYPAQKFEIINLGITAINSHVILPIARECARQEGDLWIIYMGNNEMVGPFGAATVFGAQAPPVAFVRLSLALQDTRLGQLMQSLAGKLKRKSSETRAWGGMQMFVDNKLNPDDRRREMVAHNFDRNLQDIVRAGAGSGAKVLLSTVAVNLKDCAPFASADATNNSADLQFNLGQDALQLSNATVARAHLQSACDLDTLPFRADSRINAIIAQTAGRFPADQLRVLDAANALAINNPAGVCGQETFYEHVHFNFDGSYRLARLWADQIETIFGKTLASAPRNPWPAQEVCEERLGLTDWNRCAVIDSVIQRLYAPPLSTQAGNAKRIEFLRSWVKELRSRMTTAAAPRARAIYLDALKRAPDDYYLHENYAAFLLAMKEPAQATLEWRRVHELIPDDFIANYRLAEVLLDQNILTEAEPLLLSSLSSHPGFTEGWLKLGQLHAQQSKLDLALEELTHARRLHPQDPPIFYELGRVFSRLNRSPESIASFREAVRLQPDYWEAHYTLGGELGMHGQIAEARGEFEHVIKLKPEFPAAHLNLGVALMKQGHWDEAREQFEQTLRLEPNNPTAPAYLAQLRAVKRPAP